MRKDFFPDREADMIVWGQNFALRTSAEPEAYHLTPEIAADFAAAQQAFAEAYRVANEPGTRTRPAVTLKNDLRKAMERKARWLAATVRSNPSIPEGRKILAGICTVPPGRGPAIPRPTAAPSVLITGTAGRRLTIRLVDPEHPYSGAKPRGVRCAVLFLHVGDQPPVRWDGWKHYGAATRMTTQVTIPARSAPGEKVLVCARWQNPAGQLGPVSKPAYAYVPFAMELPRNVA
jgi:hypothetical protein